jgi:hypothetical protein
LIEERGPVAEVPEHPDLPGWDRCGLGPCSGVRWR